MQFNLAAGTLQESPIQRCAFMSEDQHCFGLLIRKYAALI